jgi:hypothetical protein
LSRIVFRLSRIVFVRLSRIVFVAHRFVAHRFVAHRLSRIVVSRRKRSSAA